MEENLTRIQDKLGFEFSNLDLLKEALTTPAFAKQNNVSSYERLEFLGDAVAKIIMADILFNRGNMDADEMTKERNILESNKVFAHQAIKLGIIQDIFSLVPIQKDDIGVLADVYEALCGAIFLDSGKDLDVVRDILIQDIIDHEEEYLEISPDQFKNVFLEAVQKIFGFTPEIKMDYTEYGPDHDKKFKAWNLRVIHPADGDIVLQFPYLRTLESYSRKKDAEKALMKLAFEDWRENNFMT